MHVQTQCHRLQRVVTKHVLRYAFVTLIHLETSFGCYFEFQDNLISEDKSISTFDHSLVGIVVRRSKTTARARYHLSKLVVSSESLK